MVILSIVGFVACSGWTVSVYVIPLAEMTGTWPILFVLTPYPILTKILYRPRRDEFTPSYRAKIGGDYYWDGGDQHWIYTKHTDTWLPSPNNNNKKAEETEIGGKSGNCTVKAQNTARKKRHTNRHILCGSA